MAGGKRVGEDRDAQRDPGRAPRGQGREAAAMIPLGINALRFGNMMNEL
jgi:hypothetical protein